MSKLRELWMTTRFDKNDVLDLTKEFHKLKSVYIIKAVIKLAIIKNISLDESKAILLPVFLKGKLKYTKRYGLFIKATKSKKENWIKILELLRINE